MTTTIFMSFQQVVLPLLLLRLIAELLFLLALCTALQPVELILLSPLI